MHHGPGEVDMMRSNVLQLFLLISVAALIGCSQATALSSPAIDPPVRDVNQSHNLMGLYTFACDPVSGSIDIVDARETGLHLNALKFLEPPPFLYLTLESAPKFNGNVLDIDIGLRHPFLGMDIYSGLDVCGIVFTRGSVTGFADPDIIMAGDGDTRLLNADGYTRW